MNQVQTNSDKLLSQINDIRKLLIITGLTKGLNNAETLKYSEELDKLIIQIQLQKKA
ncbi:aspartyl-phosphate phosphatase Spo0E family protein [Domibacillus epiphyticus]|uniref:Spo0E family sporulation regulatory protein-aspartic acid phosphatase n=1 Tax=Domibacillus epiphyticus TaxID=1714355 RepID=A0A1V2A5E9_9BACI|nr:aspartyl-phosphate phosphatase Spo0E family protein [Domibacillus epiphyticus]OMP66160.1 hypothetical protein BTO28_13645 [Domibacillus epiphyticus]